MQRIGEIIKKTRKQYGLNQRAFAESLTVSQSYISRVEHGKETPTLMFLKLFCLLYEVDEKVVGMRYHH